MYTLIFDEKSVHLNEKQFMRFFTTRIGDYLSNGGRKPWSDTMK